MTTVPRRIVPALALLLTLSARAADPDAPAAIVVGSDVVATDVEPIGANLTTIAGGTNFAINNHVWQSGFEPIVWRKLVRIDRAGDDWFEWDSFGGPGNWNLSWTGLGNGATVRFYRLVDAGGAPLAYAGGWNDHAGADHVEFLGEATVPMPGVAFPDGGWIADDSTDRVYIDDDGLGLIDGDYAFILQETLFVPRETSAPDLQEHWGGDRGGLTSLQGEYTAVRVPHPGQPLPAAFDEPGESCLEITAPNAETVRLGEYVYHAYDDGEGQWYSQLHPGAEYRVEVWARQEGLGDGGQLRVVFNQSYDAVSQTTPWQVTDSWQHFSYDFTAPAYPVDDAWHTYHALEFTGPGTLWIDDLVLYRHDAQHGNAPHGPHAISFDEMMDSMPQSGRKPAIRFYPLHYSQVRMESMFGNHSDSGYTVDWYTAIDAGPAATVAQAMSWALATGSGPDDRAVPYLTLASEHTEDEWLALVEFLGVPYDPAVDTPQSKPHAYARYVYRGEDGTPWTDEFREILVEYGNETWHNGAGGYGWYGFGPPEYVHHGGLEYGLFARYMFDDHVMATPEWGSLALGDKIKLVLGGNYEASASSETAYAEEAVQQGATVAYLGHANYVGPKWETGDTGSETFNDHGVQETLVGMLTGMQGLIEDAVAVQDQLNAGAGTDYRVIAYEGGPSGYWQNQDDPEVDELYGKSLAMGVAALDAWLYSSEAGYGHQCYLGFASGHWWSSHTLPEDGGFRPHPGWLALKLRNRYARGDEMLETTLTSVPTYERAGSDVPLVGAYTLTDGDSVSVFVLSRKLDGVHDDVDFGDGATPTTLELPFEDPVAITLYRLADPDGSPADPRENNRETMNVEIVTESLDAAAFTNPFVIDETTGGVAGGMPPGTVYLYVFELTGTGDDDSGDDDGADDDGADDDDDGGGGDCECRADADGRRGLAPAWGLVVLAGCLIWRRRG